MKTDDASISILLIEDDEVDIEDALRQFKLLKAPLTLHVAKDGMEALDRLYGRNNAQKIEPTPKAIILDTNMPKMDGIEFLKKLRSDSQFGSVPVFMLTGEYSTRDKLASNDLNVAGRIVKPLLIGDVQHIYWVISSGHL